MYRAASRGLPCDSAASCFSWGHTLVAIAVGLYYDSSVVVHRNSESEQLHLTILGFEVFYIGL